MLKSVHIKNFGSLPNANYEFSSGLNVVIGENGLGKTQLLKLLYATLKVHADAKEFTKTSLEKAYAAKLVGVFRPEKLGRLVKRKQGSVPCEIALTMAEHEQSCTFGFSTGSSVSVQVDVAPTAKMHPGAVFIPTRELVTLCPWFVPLYDNYHLRFEETWRDTVSLLGAPNVKGSREQLAETMLEPLEQLMRGKVVVDSGTGEFYLHVPGEGKTEMPLLAEGLRKVAMLARLISTGALLDKGCLFWDEPESNLNPKIIKTLAACLVALANAGVQVFIASHSLFLLREIELVQMQRKARVPARFIGLAMIGESVSVEQSKDIAGIQNLVLLDEELHQTDRYLANGVEND